jgi:Fic family protein
VDAGSQVQAAARAFSQPAEHTTKPAKKRRKSPPRSLRDPKLDSQYYRASDLAQILNLSEDTIRRMFEDEPDVIVLGDKNPRGKRRRLTLRIPKSVFDRVCKRLAN